MLVKPYWIDYYMRMQYARGKVYSLLRSSERFFKTDMIYLAKGGFWLNSGQIITTFFSFGLAFLFARMIPKEIYGNYKYILSLAGLIATFSLTGISTAVLQSVARGFPGTFITAVKVLIKWNSIILILSICGAAYYITNDNYTLGYGLIIVAIFFPIIRILEVYEAYVSGKKDFKKSALYRGSVDIGVIIATALGIMFTDNVVMLLAINLGAQFFLNTIFFKKVFNSISKEDRLKTEPNIINFSKHLSLQNIMSNVAAHLDKIIIFHYLGATEVAIYTFATALPQQIRGVFSNLTLLITPKISHKTAQEAVPIIKGRFLLSLIVLVPVVLVYILSAPLIFKTLFPAYMDAVPYTQWYSLILLILGNLSNLVLTTQKAAKEQYIITAFASLSQIILMLTLVNDYGILGIIWAILISKFMVAILSYILAQNLLKKTA